MSRLLIILCALWSASYVRGEEQGPSCHKEADGKKTYYALIIDRQYVLQTCQAMKDLRKKLNAMQEVMLMSLEDKEMSLRAEDESIRKNRKHKKEEEYTKLKNDLEKKIQNLKKVSKKWFHKLQETNHRASVELDTVLSEKLRVLRQQRHAELILERAVVHEYDAGCDVTQDILVLMDQDYPGVKTDIPAFEELKKELP